jgi:hypothetical protein
MPKASGTRFGPVGRCIYCRSEDGPLTDEHIVPANLGGDIILEEASCTTCQKTINENIENPAMQRLFREIRYRRGIGSRRKNKRPKTLPLKVPVNWDRDASAITTEGRRHDPEQWKSKEVAYDQHLSPLILYWFNPPGILRGLQRSYSDQNFVRGLWKYLEPIKAEPEEPIYVETQFNGLLQLKLIAKIAHVFDVAGLYPNRITITAGLEATQHGTRTCHVPKAMLISNLEARSHTGELRIAAAASDAGALKEELKDFKRKVSEAGRATYSARVGAHDDLVLCVAIALWMATQGGVTIIEPFPVL